MLATRDTSLRLNHKKMATYGWRVRILARRRNEKLGWKRGAADEEMRFRFAVSRSRKLLIGRLPRGSAGQNQPLLPRRLTSLQRKRRDFPTPLHEILARSHEMSHNDAANAAVYSQPLSCLC